MQCFTLFDKYTDAPIPDSSFTLPLKLALGIDLIKTLHEMSDPEMTIPLPLLRMSEDGCEAELCISYLRTCFDPREVISKRRATEVTEGTEGLYESISDFNEVKRRFFMNIIASTSIHTLDDLFIRSVKYAVHALLSIAEMGRYLGIQAMAFEACITLAELLRNTSPKGIANLLSIPQEDRVLEEAGDKAATLKAVMSLCNKERHRLFVLTIKRG